MDTLRTALVAARENRDRARRHQDAKERDLERLVVAAVAAGVPKIEVSQRAHVSRPTIDAMIERAASPRRIEVRRLGHHQDWEPSDLQVRQLHPAWQVQREAVTQQLANDLIAAWGNAEAASRCGSERRVELIDQHSEGYVADGLERHYEPGIRVPEAWGAVRYRVTRKEPRSRERSSGTDVTTVLWRAVPLNTAELRPSDTGPVAAAVQPLPPIDLGQAGLLVLDQRDLSNERLARVTDVLGEVVTARCYQYWPDVVLDTGQHPQALPDLMPLLLLGNAAGLVIGVADCNSGYDGSGPSNTAELLRRFGFHPVALDYVRNSNYLHLWRDSAQPAASVSPGVSAPLQVIGGRAVAKLGISDRGPRLHVDPAPDITKTLIQLLDDPRLGSWAQGPVVVRCYRTRDDARRGGFTDQPQTTFGRVIPFGMPNVYTCIVERGALQVWLPTRQPEPHEVFDRDSLAILAALDLSVDGRAPAGRWGRTLASLRTHPPFVDVSADGSGHLSGTLLHPTTAATSDSDGRRQRWAMGQ